MSDSSGRAYSVYNADPASFIGFESGSVDVVFDVVAGNFETDYTLTLQVEGNTNPEYDVSEFKFYPNFDSLNVILEQPTTVSVIAKNSSGSGISNIPVRFELSLLRESNGIISTPYHILAVLVTMQVTMMMKVKKVKKVKITNKNNN